MALTICPECGHQVSTNAAACPSCGFQPVSTAAPNWRATGPVEPAQVGYAQAAPTEKRLGRWLLAAKVFAIFMALVFVFSIARGSFLVGSLLVLGAIALGVGVLVGRFVGGAPPALAQGSRWLLARPKWLGGTVAVMLIGGSMGLSARGEGTRGCEDAVSNARALRNEGASHATVDEAFDKAVQVCADISLDEEAAAMRSEREEAAAAEQKSQAAAAEVKKRADLAAQKEVVEDARQLAAKDKHAEAVERYAAAAQLGPLPAEDKPRYARALREHGRAELAAKRAEQAQQALIRAKQVDPTLDGIDEPLAAAKQLKRQADVKTWIADARAIGQDKGRCDTMLEISNAWKALQSVTKDDRLYGQAVMATAVLERCRKSSIATMAKGVRDLMKLQREQWAEKYERSLLGEGLDVRVKLSGLTKNHVTIQYVLFNRAWAFKITDGGKTTPDSFLGGLQKIGFKKVTFSNGFGDSTYYDLEPEPEDDGATAKGFADMGLDKPLRLR
jgi:tetratricopeptide (TPR) repeat protein